MSRHRQTITPAWRENLLYPVFAGALLPALLGLSVCGEPTAGAVDVRTISLQFNLMRENGTSSPAMRSRSRSHAMRPISSTGCRMAVRGGLTARIQE
jgi:hypothetical protein